MTIDVNYSIPPSEKSMVQSMTVRLTRAQRAVSQNVRVVIIPDRSGSMDGHKIRAAYRGTRTAIKELLPLGDDVKVAVVLFDEHAQVAFPFTSPAELLKKLQKFATGGGTAIGNGIRTASNLVASESADVIIFVLLSDGGENGQSDPAAEAQECKAAGVTICSIAYGSQADAHLLQSIASDGLFFESSSEKGALEAVLAHIAKSLTESVQVGTKLSTVVNRK